MDKNIYRFIFYLLFFTSFESYGQFLFKDDFENGEMGNWGNAASWNISNQFALGGNYSLHHNLTGIRSSSFINRTIPLSGFNNVTTIWDFKIKNGNWIFGATEQLCFYLISDKSDLASANGYAVGVNLIGTDNKLKLCRMANGIAAEEIVQTDFLWKAGTLLEVEVTHQFGLWKVRFKDGAINDWSNEKTGIEQRMNFFYSTIGASFKFNTLHGSQLWIDDVSMYLKNNAPSLYDIQPTGRNRILVLFSEEMSQLPLLQADNYKVQTSAGIPVNILSIQKLTGDSCGVYLELGDFKSSNLSLTINNQADKDGMPLVITNYDFTFIPVAQFGDIVFNELMADPTPTVQLPDAEYIELKNTSEFPFILKNWRLDVNGKQKVLPDKVVGAGEYLILCGTGSYAILNSYGSALEISGLSLANDGFVVKLYSSTTTLIDSFSYKPGLHRTGFSGGGYSLERIDPMRLCGALSNWETSKAAKGGTPGSSNAVFRNNLDNTPPRVNKVTVKSPALMEVLISEIPDVACTSTNLFSYSPSLPIPDSIRFDHESMKYSIFFPVGSIKNGIDYELTISGLTDECGNISVVEHQEFWCYLPKSGDILINEVLFNPFPGGVDFVEIYNYSGHRLKLEELYLASRDKAGIIKSYYPLSGTSELLLDAQYAAFTSDSALLLTNYYSNCPFCIFRMEQFPVYNLDEGWVVLLNKEMSVIDEFHYVESMHHPLISNVKGISLERNSFSRASDDPSNWHSASKTVGFATPGYRNSAMELISHAAEMVNFEPAVFSPNDDGLNDRFLIRLSPGGSGWMANIRIYNESGVEIKRLANNQMIGNSDVIEWNGTKENHQKAGLGIYIVKVELFGLQGGRKQFKTVCVLTDRLE
jgi:hypothetical protein